MEPRTKARLILIAIFVGFRALDVITLLVAPPLHRRAVLASLLLSAMWSTVLLVAIWCGRRWARYTLAILMLLALSMVCVSVPQLLVLGKSILLLFPFMLGVYLTTPLMLLYLPSLRTLTKR